MDDPPWRLGEFHSPRIAYAISVKNLTQKEIITVSVIHVLEVVVR